MKKLSTAIAAIALFGTPALAADMAVKSAPAAPAPAPVYSWTGWYVGVNFGGTWGDNRSTGVTSYAVQGFGDGVGPGSYAANSAAGATGNVTSGNSGFIGGGQIGFNWQFSPVWVAGFEADIQGLSDKGTGTLNTTVGPFAFVGAAEVINSQITATREVDYLGTVRGRAGFLWTPTFLLYGTGGLAYGGVKASTSIAASNNDCAQFPGDCIATNAGTSGGISQTKTGWTAGGGFEWMVDPRWSFKAEYLYYDLGSVTYGSQLVTPNPTCGTCGAGPAIVNSQSTAKFNGNIARVGLDYHF